MRKEFAELLNVISWYFDQRELEFDPRPQLPFCPLEYKVSHLNFMLLSKELQAASRPTKCRDFLNEAIRTHVCGSDCPYVDLTSHAPMDFENPKLLLFLDYMYYFPISMDEGIRTGMKVVNFYGQLAGWGPVEAEKFKFSRPNFEGYHDCYIIYNLNKWIRNPVLISMMLLLIRTCLLVKVPETIRNVNELNSVWKLVIEEDYYKAMPILMAHVNEILDLDISKAYGHKSNLFHHKSGFYSLVMGHSIFPDSVQKLRKFMRWRLKRR